MHRPTGFKWVFFQIWVTTLNVYLNISEKVHLIICLLIGAMGKIIFMEQAFAENGTELNYRLKHAQ